MLEIKTFAGLVKKKPPFFFQFNQVQLSQLSEVRSLVQLSDIYL